MSSKNKYVCTNISYMSILQNFRKSITKIIFNRSFQNNKPKNEVFFFLFLAQEGHSLTLFYDHYNKDSALFQVWYYLQTFFSDRT